MGLLVRELETPKLAQIFVYGTWLYLYITKQSVTAGPKMPENAQF